MDVIEQIERAHHAGYVAGLRRALEIAKEAEPQGMAAIHAAIETNIAILEQAARSAGSA